MTRLRLGHSPSAGSVARRGVAVVGGVVVGSPTLDAREHTAFGFTALGAGQVDEAASFGAATAPALRLLVPGLLGRLLVTHRPSSPRCALPCHITSPLHLDVSSLRIYSVPMQSDGELAQRLLLACADLTRAVTAAAEDTRLSLTQARVLGNLDRHGPLRVSHLAALEHCAQPSMTGLVGRLDAAGYATRNPDPEDARAVLVAVTPAGLDELARHRVLLREPLVHAVDGLDPDSRDDLARFTSVLEELTGSVRTGETVSPQKPPGGVPCRPPTPM